MGEGAGGGGGWGGMGGRESFTSKLEWRTCNYSLHI